MKTITAKLLVKIEDSNDINRTFELEKDDDGWISIGAGKNSHFPKIKIHPYDVEKFIATIYAVVKAQLPTDL